MASQQVALKIAFGGDIHRTRVELRCLSLAELTQLMAQTFRLPVGDFVVQYRDPEGDSVNVTTDAEFQEALRVFLSSSEPLHSLKFSAATRRQTEKDNAESPKTAAGVFSSFAQGLVGQINHFIPEKKTGEATAAPFAAPVSAPEPEQKLSAQNPQVVTLLPAPVGAASPAQETEETPSIASSVAFSEAEVKWAEQLSIVSGIFPNTSPARVINILEKSDGNLNVVLNVLTEET
ncbi:uncharacterized protein PITG_19590 [Phytophthora infestans T30-4]|uniref:PB1 domain-containing protein n=1 Tax=Phytophthora infestans (strain T30-4) TaxID=403677 RepID=D0P0V1_PHYIT|nr:uncharacterized protein PITG_19590 [Phytophthora infestans T30-4]EEY53073.1 conserved hypothetical protein [Phytophthora infestans T30-4]|eukprot:XP_002896067.1 conserved hypothetical protein [Phytophthora infestans T30-4]